MLLGAVCQIYQHKTVFFLKLLVSCNCPLELATSVRLLESNGWVPGFASGQVISPHCEHQWRWMMSPEVTEVYAETTSRP